MEKRTDAENGNAVMRAAKRCRAWRAVAAAGIAATILASACALFLSCADCGDMFHTIVTYEVEGTAQNVSVRYHNDYGSTEYYSSVKLPWVYRFTIKYRDEEYYGGGAPRGNYPAYISAATMRGPATLVVRIYVNDKLVREEALKPNELTVTARYAVYW